MSFLDAMLEELQRTPWMAGEQAEAIVSVFAEGHEAGARSVKDAVLMQDPLLAPDDAVAVIAEARHMIQAPPESLDEFRERLAGHLEHWSAAGAAAGYIDVFRPYGFDETTVAVFSNHEVGGFWDGNADWQSRVFPFLDSRAGYFSTDGLWTDDAGLSGLWQENESSADEAHTFVWDSSASLADLSYFRRAIRLQKADYAYPVTIAVWLAGAGALPDGYWDSPGVYDDGSNWTEGDGQEVGVYWTLGNVWGQEIWLADGVDAWTDEEGAMVDLPESEEWVAFPGED